MRKIDFFGGLHGNYLDLVISVCIGRINYDLSRPQFTENGACHVKVTDPTYERWIQSTHWSQRKIPFSDDDLTVRIVPQPEDMLIAITNSFVRAGDVVLDIKNLDQNTRQKFEDAGEKGKTFLATLVDEQGAKDSYPREILRNYFYSMFDDPECGINRYREFDPLTPSYHEFNFADFFSIDRFYQALNLIAHYLKRDFYPDPALYNLHQEFLKLNHGWNSELRCRDILDAIISGRHMTLDLNIVEEAWINYKISRIYRSYDHDLLWQTSYPTNTSQIHQLMIEWKNGS